MQLPFILFLPVAQAPQTGSFKIDLRFDQPMVVSAGGGGPGAPLLIGEMAGEEISTYYLSSMLQAALHEGRPYVLMDNRGVGSSKPRLTCPEFDDELINSGAKAFSAEEWAERGYRLSVGCLQRFWKIAFNTIWLN